MLLLALGQPEFYLGKSPLGKIEPERDKCESLLLRLAKQLMNLLAVEEQFPRPEGLVIHEVAMAIGTDMAMVEKDLGTLHAGVTVL